jgi:Tol biopolymer transport system component/DNA-binding winged helix-turn-helix (wHTH) protein
MSAPTNDLAGGTPAPRPADPSVRFQFGPFRLDPAERLLLREGRPVALTPKAFDLLLYLVQRPGRLVDKHALMTALWPDAVVEETNLAYTVSAIRKALGDGNDGEQLIQTVPTRGYRFVAPVQELASGPAPSVRSRAWRWRVALVAAGLTAGIFIGAFVVRRRNQSDPTPRQISRFELPAAVGFSDISIPAISPDGTRIVYSASAGAGPQLFLRMLDGLDAVALPGTVGGRQPFFSPDGQAIAFVGSNGLMTLDLATGRLARGHSGVPFTLMAGGAWARDGRIYVGRNSPRGISVITAGGEPAALTSVTDDEIAHSHPVLLPSGRHLLFTVSEGDELDEARIDVVSLETAERRTVLRGGFCARYLPTGHLVYARGGALYAVAFDPGLLQVVGTPVRVLDGIAVLRSGAALFSVSPVGTLVYHQGGVRIDQTEIAWFDSSNGTERAVSAPRGSYVDPSLSPDDKRLALAPRVGRSQDIWVHDFARGTWTRVTTSPRFEAAPVWHPVDPTRIVFTGVRPGRESAQDLMSVAADGSAAPELLYESGYSKWATSSAPAARLLAFVESRPDTNADVWLLDLRDKPVARPFLQTPFSESCPALSPDGQWLAYESNESGRAEIYVRAVSGAERKWQVSPDGGDRPRWSRNGRRIVYRSGKRMMVVDVETAGSFTAGQPQVLAAVSFEPGGLATPNYDISADGRRILLITPVRDPPRLPLIVVENWFAELRDKMGR